MHRREEERAAWSVRQLTRHIVECEQYISAQIELIAELKRHGINVVEYTARLSKFEAEHQLRIQERDLLVDRSNQLMFGDQIDLMALKIAGLSTLNRP